MALGWLILGLACGLILWLVHSDGYNRGSKAHARWVSDSRAKDQTEAQLFVQPEGSIYASRPTVQELIYGPNGTGPMPRPETLAFDRLLVQERRNLHHG